MYNASTRFHQAAYEKSPSERVLIKFADNTFFANEDIVATAGLRFVEAVNNEEELTIGLCPSATLDFTVFNEKGLLSGYGFGECEAYIGLRVSSAISAYGAGVTAVLNYGGENEVVFRGSKVEPWLTVNGETPTVQPPFPVCALLIVGANIYCIAQDGRVWGASWVDGHIPQGELVPLGQAQAWGDLAAQAWDDLSDSETIWDDFVTYVDLNTFMTDKLKNWARAGRSIWYNDNTLYEFYDNAVDQYEYVPLGRFVISKPEKRRISQIAVSAYDNMSKFDVDAGEFWAGITYPTTIGGILSGLCAYVGVSLATTSFINSTRSFAEAPAQFEGVTCREVLKWIAEAACAYARMTRDGELELVWFGTESVAIPMTQYFSIDVAEYQVAQIDKLQVLNADADIGVILGAGNNGYQIVDNPMLYGTSDTQIRTWATPVYNRLAAYAAFSPINAVAVCDWSIQAGDVIEIVLNGVTHKLPVYRQTIAWNGCARVVYESTGAEVRPVLDAVNRRLYRQNIAMHELTVNVDGISSRLTDAEGSITTLELTTDGLKLAVDANKLSFNADGLTIQGGGLVVKNLAGQNVLYADTEGNLTVNGKVIAKSGEVGGFVIGETTLEADGTNSAIVLDAAEGKITVGGTQGQVEIRGNEYGYPEIHSSGLLDVGGANGLTLSIGEASPLVIGMNGTEPTVFATSLAVYIPLLSQYALVSPVFTTIGTCTYQWGDIPQLGSMASNPSLVVVASDAGSVGYVIKTRFSGAVWQWCIDGSSGSTVAQAIITI